MSDTISVRDHSQPCEHGSLWPHWFSARQAKWWQTPDCLGGHEMTLRRIYDDIPGEVFVQADLALRRLAYETGGRVLYPNTFGQLNNIYAPLVKFQNQFLGSLQVGVAGSDKGNKGLFAHLLQLVEFFIDTVCHVSFNL